MKIIKSKAITKISCAFMIAFLIMHAIGMPIVIAASADESTASGHFSSSDSSSSSGGSDNSGDSSSKKDPESKKSDSSENNDSGKKTTTDSGSSNSNNSSSDKTNNTDSGSSGGNASGSTDASSKNDTTNPGQSNGSSGSSTDPGNSTNASNNNGSNTDTGLSGQSNDNSSSNSGSINNENNGNGQTAGNSNGGNNGNNTSSSNSNGSTQETTGTGNIGTSETNPTDTNTDLSVGTTSPDLGIGTTDPNLGIGTTEPVIPMAPMMNMMAPMMFMAPLVPTGSPTITINGSDPATVTQGSTYNDAGATAVDSLGNSIPVDTVSNVDTTIIGTYSVTYTATDSAGNTATASRTVEVVASAPIGAPIITILGSNPATVTQGNIYNDAGATAVDYMGMSLTVSAVSNVDTSIVGSYSVSYSATDSLGNTSTASRTVDVVAVSMTSPVITILGNNPDTVTQNTTYTDPGATAVDGNGNSLTVSAISNLDTAIVGTYTITYSATDSLGQTSTATRTVDVTTAVISLPVITVLGNNPETVTQNSTYTDAGATAVDGSGNYIPVSAVSNVDTSIVGTYSVTYSATDSSGNTTTATRTVEVVAASAIAPTITILGNNPDSVTINSTYADAGATATDSLGVPLTVTSVSNVDTSIIGTYSVTYSATDAGGLTATVTRTVNVVAASTNSGGTTTSTTSTSSGGGHHHHHHHHNNHGHGGSESNRYVGPEVFRNFYGSLIRTGGQDENQLSQDENSEQSGTEEGSQSNVSGSQVLGTQAEFATANGQGRGIAAWPWVLIALAYLAIFNYLLWMPGAFNSLRWASPAILTAGGLLVWYIFDPIHSNSWFPYTIIAIGIISYLNYYFRFRNIKTATIE